jgi:hypothetical protein
MAMYNLDVLIILDQLCVSTPTRIGCREKNIHANHCGLSSQHDWGTYTTT